MVRIHIDTHAALAEFARDDGVSLGDAIDRLVEDERRRRMWNAADAAYAAVLADPEARAEGVAEVALWQTTNADGLPEAPEGAR